VIYSSLRKLVNYVDSKTKNKKIKKAIKTLKAKKAARTWGDENQRHYDFYSKFIKKGDLAFDVGANIGIITKVFLKLGAKCVSVEPQNECIFFLEQGYRKNPNFTLIKKALGAIEGKMEIMQSETSVVASLSKEWIEKVQKSGRFSDFSWKKTQEVEITTLDILISQFGIPSFIKIDVEGFEFEVIKGLSAPVKCLSLELVPEFIQSTINCIDYLSKIGEYSFNYTLMNDLEFILPVNVKKDEIINILLNYSEKHGDSFSDLYCFLDE
jgi:FkbM family methyltransferase